MCFFYYNRQSNDNNGFFLHQVVQRSRDRRHGPLGVRETTADLSMTWQTMRMTLNDLTGPVL